MPNLPICPQCGNKVEKNQPSKGYKKRTYHLSCYQEMCDKLYKVEQKREGLSTPSFSEETPQKQLEKYICKIFKIEEMTPFLRNQLLKICTENPRFTYDGIKGSLYYYFDIKQHDPDIKFGIGIVPYIYEDAKEFFAKKSRIAKQTEQLSVKNADEVVHIRTPKRQGKHLIDISKL